MQSIIGKIRTPVRQLAGQVEEEEEDRDEEILVNLRILEVRERTQRQRQKINSTTFSSYQEIESVHLLR